MKTITNLAWSNIKKDRVRSMLMIISIFMTTVLLTMIAVIGNGMTVVSKANAGLWYGTYYGTYKNITEEQAAQMKLRSEFTDIGKKAVFGMVDSDRDLFLAWADDMCMEMNNMVKQLAEGSYPVSGNDIAAQPCFFEALGYLNAAVGDRITVPYRVNLSSSFKPQEFVICGILEEPEITPVSSVGYVSGEFYQAEVPKVQRIYQAYFRMDESLELTTVTAREFMETAAEKIGVDKKYVDDNFAYLMWQLGTDTETIVMCGAIILLVICFSVIVIYNIFQVGIVQMVQEYGKLKAVGATRKQMRKIVSREGAILTAFGVLTGVAAGFLLSVVVFHWMFGLIIEVRESAVNQVSLFRPEMLLLAAGLAAFAVWIALRKPMRIVASVSPVEAMRYQEPWGRKKGRRKGKRELGVFGLTMAKLSGNKRRTIVTIISMGLSCVLFVVLSNLLGNMDMEYAARRDIAHGQFQIELDYSLQDEAYPENNLDHILAKNPLDQSLIEEIRKLPHVSGIKTANILYTERLDGQKEKLSVSVMDREDFEISEKDGSNTGTFDYDQVSAANGVIYGWSHWLEYNGYSIGQSLSLQAFDGTGSKEWQTSICGAFGSADTNLVMTQDSFRSLGFDDGAVDKIWIDCDPEDIEAVKSGLNELLSGIGHVKLKSYQDVFDSYDKSIQLMKSIGYTICIMIAFISFMNMANTMITSIITRKQEFAVLQAIGMTNSQMNRSLQLEGILFTAGPVLVSLVAGIPLGYLAFCYGKANGIIGLYEYQFPYMETIGMVLALAGMQIVLSWLLSRNMKKESLVERIRYQG